MIRNLSGWHLIIVAFIVILLFGSSKLPELARGVGQSLRILRREVADGDGEHTGARSAEPAASDD